MTHPAFPADPRCRLSRDGRRTGCASLRDLIREVSLAARAESLIERRAQDVGRHPFVNRRSDRPAPFARIGDAPGERFEIRVGG